MTKLNKVTTLVYHHTATDDLTIDNMRLSMQRKRGRIPAHYIVGADGGFQKIEKNEGLNVGATLNAETNMEAIQIETIGNFNNRRPTLNQYKTLWQLTERIEQKYGNIRKTLHRDESATACPGKFFDVNMIKTGLIKFDISRYYSPEQKQITYLSLLPGYFGVDYVSKFTSRGYEAGHEFDVCMNCGCNDKKHQLYDCTTPADGGKLTSIGALKVVACPKEYKLGTRFYIENYGEVVCRDRGGAINKQNGITRLDLRVGYGDEGRRNIQDKTVLHGERNGYVVK